MKYLFVGPTLFGRDADLSGLVVLPPARQGDMVRAVFNGATAIGLVDGLFDAVAAVWHKEILFALANGVRVLGAASMGALRAAECRQFGMEPVGVIAESYIRGDRCDDSDVCLAHCPRELGYAPLSEPLVDVEATIHRLVAFGRLTANEAFRLQRAAAAMFFMDRTVSAMLHEAGLPEDRAEEIVLTYEHSRVSVKADDALLLVTRLRQLSDRAAAPVNWSMREPPSWRRALEELGVSHPRMPAGA
ncbi:MAG: TfuA-like protein [Devosia sp.]